MRFLIVAASVLACAVAAPSGWYGQGQLGYGSALGLGYGAALGHAAPLGLGYAAPTISSGDIQGAAIDAHVDAADHARASLDAAREYHDQAAESQGQAINAAEDHAWLSVSAAQTAHAQQDGAAAAVAPIVARQLAGHGAHGIAGHGYAAPIASHGYAAPIAAHGIAAPLAGHGIAGHGLAGSHSISTQSLTQTHPAPSAYSHGLGHGLATHGYASHGLAANGYASHGLAGHGLAAPLAAHTGASSVATQSLSQTHPAPTTYGHHGYGHGLTHGVHGLAHAY